jgi:RHS repeat-associated protein
MLRLSTGASLPGQFTLQINAGVVVDLWGNTNPLQSINLTNVGSPGTVLFQSSVGVGATSPQRLARSALGNPFLFHGQYFDYDTGLVYLRARFYDPYTGQFLQPDPSGYEDSVNLYAGLGFNPVSLRDPTGRAITKPTMTGRGANMRVANPMRPSSFTRTGTGSGANYQKLPHLTMGARARPSPAVRPSPANAMVDGVASMDRRAARDRAIASLENEMSKHTGAVGNYFQKRQLKEGLTARDVLRRKIQNELGGVHGDFMEMVVMRGKTGTEQLQNHIAQYKGDFSAVSRMEMEVVSGSKTARGYSRIKRSQSFINVATDLDSAGQVIKTAAHEFAHDWLTRLGDKTPWGTLDYQGTKAGLEEVLAELHGVRQEFALDPLGNVLGKSSERLLLEQKGLRGLVENIAGRYGIRNGFDADELLKAYFPGVK